MTIAGCAAAVDLFGSISTGAADLPADLVSGLAQLAASPPVLWPIDQLARWPAVVDQVKAFARQWDGRARAAGWTDVSLYGLHRCAPYANVAGMGAAFLVALSRGSVVAVGADAIAIVSQAGSRLKIYRRPPDPAAAVAWSLVSDNAVTRVPSSA